MLANGIFVSQISLHKRFTDDDFRGLVQPVAFIEGLPTQQRNPKSREISRIGPANDGVLTLARRQWGMLGDHKAVVAPVALAWN